jgi:hypothetical protein
MPHWYGLIDTGSPSLLKSCNGDPVLVHKAIMQASPESANVREISWETGKDVAAIVVEGPTARDFLETLEARDVVELVNAYERREQRDLLKDTVRAS